jgi:hypothetical protein
MDAVPDSVQWRTGGCRQAASEETARGRGASEPVRSPGDEAGLSFEAALATVPTGDRRSTNDLVEALNQGVGLHPGTARRLVGEWRASRAAALRLEVVAT